MQLIKTIKTDYADEEWRSIEGSFYYFVSNYGRVKSKKRGRPRILTPQINNKGYYRVCLTLTKGQPRYYLVHRLVAEAFIFNDDPQHKNTVHHKDERKDHNYPENLQWLSIQDNIKEYFNKHYQGVNENYDNI